jgi:predicted AlkP superfamily phosphohydrolase/phosphomutase
VDGVDLQGFLVDGLPGDGDEMVLAKPKIVIIGIDGADPSLVERFVASGACPNLERLIGRGAFGPLRSTTPPTSLPAWTSFITGATPSSHGIPDFTVRRAYGVRFTGAGDRRLPSLFAHLERQGLTVGAAWFPATYPPELLNGWQISGWDSPVTARGDESFVHPPDLHRDLTARFGDAHLSFDTIDEFSADDAWYLAAAEALPRRARLRGEMAAWLIGERPVDVAACYFGEADTAAHHFWAFHDPSSPRRPAAVEPRLAAALEAVYAAIDEAVGRVIAAAGEQSAVIVLSDHGSAGNGNVAIHLNRMLERAGLLSFSRGRALLDPRTARGQAPALVPTRLRRVLFRLAGGLLPAAVESWIRFGGIDWSRTTAFSEELSYAPSIWLNQLGREPRGTLRHRDRARATSAVERAAAELRDPAGRSLVRRVIRREEIHQGPLLSLFPDLMLELEAADGYAPVCLPSGATSGDPVTVLDGADLLGRKGRSLPGGHAPDGVLIVASQAARAGARIRSARIHDVAPIVTALAGVAPAPWFEGRVPDGALASAGGELAADDGGLAPRARRAYDRSEERVVAARLRRLGYLDW